MAAKPKSPDNYTDPALRERLKKKIMAGSKGGRPGQWSARKAQLLAHEYEQAGGGYKGGPNKQQKSLKKWGEEEWTTADGKKAVRGGETHRYLPKKAWAQLSDAEKKSTDRKKVTDSRKGKQFVANTSAAKKARKKATAGATTKRRPATKKAAAKRPATKKAAPKRPAAKKRAS